MRGVCLGESLEKEKIRGKIPSEKEDKEENSSAFSGLLGYNIFFSNDWIMSVHDTISLNLGDFSVVLLSKRKNACKHQDAHQAVDNTNVMIMH